MKVLDAIKNRYSCRSFTGEKVDIKNLMVLAQCGLHAPSGMNKQPWKIIVLNKKEVIDEMDDYVMNQLKNQEDKSSYNRMMDRGGKVYYNASSAIIIAIEEGKQLDCGIVAENIALAATSLGLGNCICGMLRVALENKEYHDLLIPEGYVFGTSILLGHTDTTPTPHEIDHDKITYIGDEDFSGIFVRW